MQVIVPTFVTKVTEYLCSGWGFFFFSQKWLVKKSKFVWVFKYHSKGIVILSSSLKRYSTCDSFSQSYGGFKIAILANLGQLTRDIFRAPNAQAEI